MRQLMQAHYEGVSEEQFLADLQAKQWVILLYDKRRLCGFSTQVVFDFRHENRLTRILFSGDTIIDKSHWGSLALPVAWGRLMLSLQTTARARSFTGCSPARATRPTVSCRCSSTNSIPVISAATPAFERTLLGSVASSALWRRVSMRPAVFCGPSRAHSGCGKALPNWTTGGCATRTWRSSSARTPAMREATNWFAWLGSIRTI